MFHFEVWQRAKGKICFTEITGSLISLPTAPSPYIVILDDRGSSWNFALDSVARISIDPINGVAKP
jgi:hypothetical protein